MNIAYVLGYLAEQYGGVSRVALNVGESLDRMGHSISCWATGNKNDKQEFSDTPFPVHLFDTAWPKRWFRSPDLVRELSSQVTSFDLLHMHGTWNHPVYSGIKIASKAGMPCLLTPHGTFQPWSFAKKRLKKKLYLTLLGRKMFKAVACLHAVTSREAEHFRMAGYRGPITVIPNGVDVEENTQLPDRAEAENRRPELKDRPIVLFMSRLSPEKGLDLLIPVWSELTKTAAYRDALLVIAGPDSRGYKKTIDGMIDKYGLASKILLTGMVTGRDKFALLRRADVFVLPSYSENFGIVVAEALACGTPVITTTGTPWKQLQDVDAGRWVLSREAELAQALRELLNMSRSERVAMGQRGQDLIQENYAWDRIVKKYLTVYDCILSGKSIPLYPEPNIE